MYCTRRPLHLVPVLQDDHKVLLGQALGFAQCYKEEATLSANMENQNKMPTSDKHARADNKEKTQKELQKRTG